MCICIYIYIYMYSIMVMMVKACLVNFAPKIIQRGGDTDLSIWRRHLDSYGKPREQDKNNTKENAKMDAGRWTAETGA